MKKSALSKVMPTPSGQLVEDSPLRSLDPRIKLLLTVGASLAVMMPIVPLAFFTLIYGGLIYWAKLGKYAYQQLWRLKWLFVFLFALDWWLVSIELAVTVTLRLILLISTFTLFVLTTSFTELQLTLEWLRFPYRYAFGLSLAFQSIGLLQGEISTVREAQIARGAVHHAKIVGWRERLQMMRDGVALTVPAIVLTTKRAWTMTEAAYARGFESPKRRPFYQLQMKTSDWCWLVGIIITLGGFTLWVQITT